MPPGNGADVFNTPSTGIWQSVWLENVPQSRIGDSSHGTVLRCSGIDTGTLDGQVRVLDQLSSQAYSVNLIASLAGVRIAETGPIPVDKETGVACLKLTLRLSIEQQSQLPEEFRRANSLHYGSCWHNQLALWSPEHPILYDLTIQLLSDVDSVVDEVQTTAGMRSISWENGDGTLRLNGSPYFQALVLDQRYWPDTNMTPPTAESCRQDIILSKKMGFNGCRKHQKGEDPLFLYWADRLGYLVWVEMPSGYDFDIQYVLRVNQEWIEVVRRDINHPCVVAWTVANESWGYNDLSTHVIEQNHIRSLYYMTKTLAPSRPVNDNCGWQHVITDLATFHDYSDGEELQRTCSTVENILRPKSGRSMFVGEARYRVGMPILCTEFGGINIATKQGLQDEWGYRTASDSSDLLERVRQLVLGIAVDGHCCGFVYTQLTDIEQETYGLYTFGRRNKLPYNEVAMTIEEAKKIYYEKLLSVKVRR